MSSIILTLTTILLVVVASSSLSYATKPVASTTKTLFQTQSVVLHRSMPFLLQDDGDLPVDSTWVTSVNYQLKTNSQAHRTDAYNQYQLRSTIRLVLRRGAPFILDVTLLSSVDPKTVSLLFDSSATDSHTWPVQVVKVTPSSSSSSSNAQTNVVSLQVQIPGNAAIGKYKLSIAATGQTTQVLCGLLLFFNPWSTADTDMYMQNTDELNEYVLSETGRMWRGSIDSFSSTPWNYRQFEVADIVLALLTTRGGGSIDMSSPVQISRALTWMIGAYVLRGRWDGRYGDGTEPTAWTGSREIYKQFAKNGSPVKYGQCWVFGGVLTTALRALGIPARPLTNFASAHDYAPYDHVIDHSAGESVWNFHVWVDAWMNRGDIGAGPCWNTVDATPQEQDDGKYQTGPAALPLLHDNKEDKPYNAPFIISEVHAAVWLGDGPYDRQASHTENEFDYQSVGQYMSTEEPNCHTASFDRETCRFDITLQYKDLATPPPLKALTGGFQLNTKVFAAYLTNPTPAMGDSFALVLKRNIAVAQRAMNVNVKVEVSLISYNGTVLQKLKQFNVAGCNLPANFTAGSLPSTCSYSADNGWMLNIDASDYTSYLNMTDALMFRASVSEITTDNSTTPYNYVWQRQISLVPPDLQTQISPYKVIEGVPFQVVVTATNPLPVPLTNLKLRVDAVETVVVVSFPDVVAPGETVTLVTDHLSIGQSGTHLVVVAFDTDEMLNIQGASQVEVFENLNLPDTDDDIYKYDDANGTNDESSEESLASN